MQSRLIKYKESLIHVSVFGNGPKQLLCFHGFGQEGNCFAVLEKELGKTFTLFAIDFPFHGKTEWKQGLEMTHDDLQNILALIVNEQQFSILAYSLGGRIALHLLQTIPGQIEQLVLIAPDGLKVNFWYWLGTQTWAGNRIFAYTMKNPQWFFALLNAGHKTGLVNKSIIKFVRHNIGEETVRLELYKRWTTLRHFKPDLTIIKAVIKKKAIPMRLLYGSYDRITLSKRSDFIKKDNDHVTVTVVEGGHELLKEKFAATIASLFSK